MCPRSLPYRSRVCFHDILMERQKPLRAFLLLPRTFAPPATCSWRQAQAVPRRRGNERGITPGAGARQQHTSARNPPAGCRSEFCRHRCSCPLSNHAQGSSSRGEERQSVSVFACDGGSLNEGVHGAGAPWAVTWWHMTRGVCAWRQVRHLLAEADWSAPKCRARTVKTLEQIVHLIGTFPVPC